MKEERYSGTFRGQPCEEDQEIWSDDLPEVKAWMLRNLDKSPNPDYASIRDHEEETTIYEEKDEE